MKTVAAYVQGHYEDSSCIQVNIMNCVAADFIVGWLNSLTGRLTEGRHRTLFWKAPLNKYWLWWQLLNISKFQMPRW
jgi:hypothetical protein